MYGGGLPVFWGLELAWANGRRVVAAPLRVHVLMCIIIWRLLVHVWNGEPQTRRRTTAIRSWSDLAGVEPRQDVGLRGG